MGLRLGAARRQASASAVIGLDGAAQVNHEAAELARTTLYGYDTWLGVLNCIGGRPQKDALLEAVRDGSAKLGSHPLSLALELFGEHGDGGIVGAFADSPWPASAADKREYRRRTLARRRRR